MPLVPMGPMLRHARANSYAIAAYNMIDYNSARAIVDGAVAVRAPVIVQVAVKTVRHWGAPVVAGWVRQLAGDAPVPVALHLDHCTSLDVIRACIDAGWTSVMFDGSSLPFAAMAHAKLDAADLTRANLADADLHRVSAEATTWTDAATRGARHTDERRARAEDFIPGAHR